MVFYALPLCERKFPAVAAPSGPYAAQLISLDCGAVSNYDARIILTKPARWRDSREVVFESYLPPEDVTLTWESATSLVVKYPPESQGRIRKALTSWQGVTITYRSR
jgi:hypothetical protein